MVLLRENKGFTYVELLIAIAIMLIFLGFFIQLDRYNITLRSRSDEVNRITMIAQGVMDAYQANPSKFAPIDGDTHLATVPPALITEMGSKYAWYSTNNRVTITVEDLAGVPASVPAQVIDTSKLKKVTVTVIPRVLGVDKVRLISYQPN